jgi:hypothetical protein
MRATVHLAAILVAALVAGCATSVDVSFDPEHDFSRYRTWAWLPGARSVQALPDEERPLDALTSRLVAAELRRLGLAHVDGGADLLVGYTLRVERQLVTVNETGAHQLLASHHSSPSYLIQSTEARVDIHDRGHLQIVMTDGQREHRVWRGELWARRRGTFSRHLPDTVSRLLGRFPAAAPPEAPAP